MPINIDKIYNYSMNDVKIVSLLNYKKKNEKKCKRCGINGHNELQCYEITHKYDTKIVKNITNLSIKL